MHGRSLSYPSGGLIRPMDRSLSSTSASTEFAGDHIRIRQIGIAAPPRATPAAPTYGHSHGLRRCSCSCGRSCFPPIPRRGAVVAIYTVDSSLRTRAWEGQQLAATDRRRRALGAHTAGRCINWYCTARQALTVLYTARFLKFTSKQFMILVGNVTYFLQIFPASYG